VKERMKRFASFSNTPKCAICDRSVYANDPQIVLDGLSYHRACAKCNDCKCQITIENFTKSGTTLYCKTHYIKKFKEEGTILGSEKFTHQSAPGKFAGSGFTIPGSESALSRSNSMAAPAPEIAPESPPQPPVEPVPVPVAESIPEPVAEPVPEPVELVQEPVVEPVAETAVDIVEPAAVAEPSSDIAISEEEVKLEESQEVDAPTETPLQEPTAETSPEPQESTDAKDSDQVNDETPSAPEEENTSV
jgi:hypothetical protein